MCHEQIGIKLSYSFKCQHPDIIQLRLQLLFTLHQYIDHCQLPPKLYSFLMKDHKFSIIQRSQLNYLDLPNIMSHQLMDLLHKHTIFELYTGFYLRTFTSSPSTCSNIYQTSNYSFRHKCHQHQILSPNMDHSKLSLQVNQLLSNKHPSINY
jgi:hypothetical protein